MDFVRPIDAIMPGAQGRILAVLAETTAELNLRTIAQLSGVSQAQASRVLPRLVDLGVVERHEVPPSSLFRLVPEHVAARVVLDLARATDTVLDQIGRMAQALPYPPVSVIVFGSFPRGEAGADSDIDVMVVRPTDIDEDNQDWAISIERWRTDVRRLTGNPVEVLEMSAHEAAARLTSRAQLWNEIRRDGRVVHGLDLAVLPGARVPKPARTKPMSAEQVHSYAAKAKEFAEAASSDLAAGRNIAATHRRSPPRRSNAPSDALRWPAESPPRPGRTG